MLIKEQIPSFPELIDVGVLIGEVAHGTSDRRAIEQKYHSDAELEYAEGLAFEKIVGLLQTGQTGQIRATGRASNEKKGTARRWEGQQYKKHSKLRTYVPPEFWSEFIFQRTSWYSTARSKNTEYVDIKIVIDDCREHLLDDILAHRNSDDEVEQDVPVSGYSTPYIDLMWQAIDEFKITDENQPIKETLVEWFLAQEISGQKVARATAEYLASFVRLPQSRTGGNRPWKVRADQNQTAK